VQTSVQYFGYQQPYYSITHFDTTTHVTAIYNNIFAFIDSQQYFLNSQIGVGTG